MLDKTEQLRLNLSAIVSNTLGHESGELFYKFHLDDDDDALIDGFRALVEAKLGTELMLQKIESARAGSAS